MNWVGGARSRIKLRSDQKMQREFFKRRRLEAAHSSRVSHSTSTPTLSLDLITFNLLQLKTRKGHKEAKPTKIIKQDLDKRSSSKTIHVNIPETPLDTLKRYSSGEDRECIKRLKTRMAEKSEPILTDYKKCKTSNCAPKESEIIDEITKFSEIDINGKNSPISRYGEHESLGPFKKRQNSVICRQSQENNAPPGKVSDILKDNGQYFVMENSNNDFSDDQDFKLLKDDKFSVFSSHLEDNALKEEFQFEPRRNFKIDSGGINNNLSGEMLQENSVSFYENDIHTANKWGGSENSTSKDVLKNLFNRKSFHASLRNSIKPPGLESISSSVSPVSTSYIFHQSKTSENCPMDDSEENYNLVSKENKMRSILKTPRGTKCEKPSLMKFASKFDSMSLRTYNESDGESMQFRNSKISFEEDSSKDDSVQDFEDYSLFQQHISMSQKSDKFSRSIFSRNFCDVNPEVSRQEALHFNNFESDVIYSSSNMNNDVNKHLFQEPQNEKECESKKNFDVYKPRNNLVSHELFINNRTDKKGEKYKSQGNIGLFGNHTQKERNIFPLHNNNYHLDDTIRKSPNNGLEDELLFPRYRSMQSNYFARESEGNESTFERKIPSLKRAENRCNVFKREMKETSNFMFLKPKLNSDIALQSEKKMKLMHGTDKCTDLENASVDTSKENNFIANNYSNRRTSQQMFVNVNYQVSMKKNPVTEIRELNGTSQSLVKRNFKKTALEMVHIKRNGYQKNISSGEKYFVGENLTATSNRKQASPMNNANKNEISFWRSDNLTKGKMVDVGDNEDDCSLNEFSYNESVVIGTDVELQIASKEAENGNCPYTDLRNAITCSSELTSETEDSEVTNTVLEAEYTPDDKNGMHEEFEVFSVKCSKNSDSEKDKSNMKSSEIITKEESKVPGNMNLDINLFSLESKTYLNHEVLESKIAAPAVNNFENSKIPEESNFCIDTIGSHCSDMTPENSDKLVVMDSGSHTKKYNDTGSPTLSEKYKNSGTQTTTAKYHDTVTQTDIEMCDFSSQVEF